MKTLEVKPGEAIVIDMGGYQHWALVSDRRCDAGKPMLISATKRTGTVQEETWDTVVASCRPLLASLEIKLTSAEVLSAAREHIGKWQYSVMSRNCEHFITLVTGHPVSSTQVIAGVGGALVGAAAAANFAKNPDAIKLLAGAALIAGIAVYAVRRTEKIT